MLLHYTSVFQQDIRFISFQLRKQKQYTKLMFNIAHLEELALAEFEQGTYYLEN